MYIGCVGGLENKGEGLGTWITVFIHIKEAAAWLAQLVRRQSAVREARVRFLAGPTLRVLK